jgi:hypothetical protein
LNDSDIHLGDIGTKYKIQILDNGVPFDPSDATVKEILFKFNDGTILTRNATIEEDEDTGIFYLVYVVTSDTFHTVSGNFSIQARLEFADGSLYHSSIQTTDDGGNILTIAPNLDTE